MRALRLTAGSIEPPRMLSLATLARAEEEPPRPLVLAYRRPFLERRDPAPSAEPGRIPEWRFSPTIHLELAPLFRSLSVRPVELICPPATGPGSKFSERTLLIRRLERWSQRLVEWRRRSSRAATAARGDRRMPSVGVEKPRNADPASRPVLRLWPMVFPGKPTILRGLEGRPGKDGDVTIPVPAPVILHLPTRQNAGSRATSAPRPWVLSAGAAFPGGRPPSSVAEVVQSALRFRSSQDAPHSYRRSGGAVPGQPATRSVLPIEIVYRSGEERQTATAGSQRVTSPPPPSPPAIDVRRLSRDVIRQIDRHIRIERERRGRL